MTQFTKESLRQYLERACSYTYEGEQVPFPYASDGPDMFRSPNGTVVCIPQPVGVFYEKADIDKIMSVHKIEVESPSYVGSSIAAMTEVQEVANSTDNVNTSETKNASKQ